MLEEKADDSNVNDQLQRLLQEAGLESVPIDPTSLEALKAFVANENYTPMSGAPEESSTVRATTDENRPPPAGSYSSGPPIPEVEPHPELQRFTSELTTPGADSMASSAALMEAEEAVTFETVEGASPVENQILEQLHRQTRLLVTMQRRIDDLTATVEHLTRGGGGGAPVPTGFGIPSRRTVPPHTAGGFPPNPQTMGWGAPPPTTNNNYPPQAPPPMAAPYRAAPPPPNAQPRFPQPPGQQPRVVAAAAAAAPPPPGGLLMAIRNSRVFKIAYLFWTLRRRHVQELDGGLIVKILFMMAVLTARMSSSGKGKHGDPDWHTKFAGLTLLVMIGFLMQTGYLHYIYTFFVKEKYPERIFNGEEVSDIIRNPNGWNGNDDPNNPQNNNNHGDANNQGPRPPGAPPLPRGQLPPNHPARAGAAGGGWRNTFFGGLIPDGDQGGVTGVLQDVALLFGSFLMSIFPMWQPEGPPQRPAEPQQQAPPPGGVAAGPGVVRPPRDAMQAAEDSDDED